MSDPAWVTIGRACELLAVEDAGGVLRPMSRRTISKRIAAGDIEARGSGTGRLVSRASINAYLRGDRGRWRANGSPAEPLALASSGRSKAAGRKPATPNQEAATGQRIVIPWRKPKRG